MFEFLFNSTPPLVLKNDHCGKTIVLPIIVTTVAVIAMVVVVMMMVVAMVVLNCYDHIRLRRLRLPQAQG